MLEEAAQFPLAVGIIERRAQCPILIPNPFLLRFPDETAEIPLARRPSRKARSGETHLDIEVLDLRGVNQVLVKGIDKLTSTIDGGCTKLLWEAFT